MRHRSLRFGLVAAFVAAAITAAVGAAPAAVAGIATTQITSPANHTYYVYDVDAATSMLTISGTSSGPTAAVDIKCYYGASVISVASNVSVDSHGSFSTSVSRALLTKHECTLRAIPTGTTPVDLSPYYGSTIGVGQRKTAKNNNQPYDYFIYGQQAKGAFDYDSLSSCGIDDGWLFDASLAQTTRTFYCNAWLYRVNAQAGTRSELQVDGANAYMPYSAEDIDPSATGLPSLSYSFSVNKKTGDVVIHETDPIVKCTDATFPPTTLTCAHVVSAGVTDHRTITQDHDGLLAWVTDVWTSTDRHAHKLDLLYENDNYFGMTGNGPSIEYKFPGHGSYAVSTLGENIKLPAKPGTVLLRVKGSADGDTATGRGAIVYDTKASNAIFAYESGYSAFELHQKATVPKHGDARFRFAYAQGFKQATVDKLAKDARTVFAGCTVPNVVGKGLAKARKAITHAGCTVGKIKQAVSSTIAKGTVVAENPAAGTHLDYKAKVALVVSRG